MNTFQSILFIKIILILYVAQAGANYTPMPRHSGCYITNCQKFGRGDDLQVKFNTKNATYNYIDVTLMVECDNKKERKLCQVPFWKANTNNLCTLLVNSSSNTITVKGGSKYRSCNVTLVFYKTVHCIIKGIDKIQKVEAEDGGDEATTVTDLSPSNFTNSTLGSTAPRTATQRAVAQSTIQTIKEPTMICKTGKNTLSIRLIIIGLSFCFTFH